MIEIWEEKKDIIKRILGFFFAVFIVGYFVKLIKKNSCCTNFQTLTFLQAAVDVEMAKVFAKLPEPEKSKAGQIAVEFFSFNLSFWLMDDYLAICFKYF